LKKVWLDEPMWDGRNVARPLTKPSRKRVGKASKEALVEMEKAMENMEVEVMGNSKLEENVDIYMENYGKLRKKYWEQYGKLWTYWNSECVAGAGGSSLDSRSLPLEFA
jgi:hypothetical protein